ncbi:hypothetical protein PYW07_017229 [Mythimna separata]|uniref:BPTI/Kunitz inhibitor domain-containing protein n=1 Tax=Mythimna separata TaxID=271217 RepID=A0AAD8DY71_MYTSE|nr:hypothetical protein PYW07_017229 [Mythimna separata]
MEGLLNIILTIVVIVFCAFYSSSVESITLTTSKARSTGLPKPNSWYNNYRRINLEPVVNLNSTPYDLLPVSGPQRRNNLHFEWDYWCQSQPKKGDCTAMRAKEKKRFKIQKYYYNAQTDSCQTFIYAGCGGNKNNFQSKIECQRRCKSSNEVTLRDTVRSTYCDLQPNNGVCFEFVKRYYYDVRSKDCKTFIFGGCGGNQNRFDSYELCLKRCKH